MKLPRRKFLHLGAGAAALPAVSRIAWAQTYPTRPVHLIITQCIAFALAHRCRRRPKTKTSSCGRLAQIARRWDNRSKI